MKRSIITVGAGRVGRALSHAFQKAGYSLELVVSRSEQSAKLLANELGCPWSTDLSDIKGSPIIIVSVPDNQLIDLISRLRVSEKSMVVHTAGSYGNEVFQPLKCSLKGVLYPLQTFSHGREIDIAEVPFLIEGDSDKSHSEIAKLASSLSDKIYTVNSGERRIIHLAAVFVCNFVNHIYGVGETIVEKTGLPVSILEPLIDETLAKARQIGPIEAQTGPASRNDHSTIKKHLDLLSFSPEMMEIYRSITKSIMKNRLPE